MYRWNHFTFCWCDNRACWRGRGCRSLLRSNAESNFCGCTVSAGVTMAWSCAARSPFSSGRKQQGNSTPKYEMGGDQSWRKVGAAQSDKAPTSQAVWRRLSESFLLLLHAGLRLRTLSWKINALLPTRKWATNLIGILHLWPLHHLLTRRVASQTCAALVGSSPPPPPVFHDGSGRGREKDTKLLMSTDGHFPPQCTSFSC